MTKEELIKDANNYIKDLFHNLLYNVEPAMVKSDGILYNIDGIGIELIWFTKRENDTEHKVPILSEIPFQDKSNRSPWSSSCYAWTICNAPELEGYSFYINAPIGQYKVPELSRRELVDVQERIEEMYQQFGYNYIKDLAKKSSPEQ